MGNLEEVVKNFGRGASTGVAKVVDPLGTVISYADKWYTGSGFSSPRAPETVHNWIYGKAYTNPEKNVDMATGYIPRGAGRLIGGGLAAIGTYALYKAGGFLAAAFVPAVTGIYSVVNTIKKYVHDFNLGEQAGKDTYEKGSFSDGFRFGWHKGTHLYMPLIHDFEGDLTGRGIDDSHVESSIKGSSTAARRNFSSIAGTFVGGLVGAAASIATLGILPLYKSIRDTVNVFDGKKARTYEPTFKLKHQFKDGIRTTTRTSPGKIEQYIFNPA